MSNHLPNENPKQEPRSWLARIRARIDALREKGPKPTQSLGDGAAAEAARELAQRRMRIDQAIDNATQ
ncbi:MAG: hypothetical protein RMK97_01995 [Sutterellaceae bacterium]|nr:hypothetical protein [Burkholderiaceae bacterium]MDW8429266.1 hypothetical protein [Sutterellaceae bacterium]